MDIKAQGSDSTAGKVITNRGIGDGLLGGGTFYFTCYDQDGNLKWEDSAKNLVVNVGLQDMVNKFLKGSAYTAAWYIGLVDNTGFTAYAAGDTLASHAGWTENTTYSGTNRQTATFGTPTTANPSVVNNSASVAVFAMTGTATIRGALLTATQARATTTGVLFSVADFDAPGSRSVVNGDTLNVTYSFSLGDA